MKSVIIFNIFSKCVAGLRIDGEKIWIYDSHINEKCVLQDVYQIARDKMNN